MRIQSELGKTIAHLRETRMAISGKGGVIDLTCGLKDLPDAVWSIPADASLAFQEDSSIAYEKIVPSKAEEYVYVSKIGGITRQNNNLCIADGVYELNNEDQKEFYLGYLEAGEYALRFEGDFTGAAVVSGGGDDAYINDFQFFNEPNREFRLEVWSPCEVTVYIVSEFGDNDPSLPENQDLPRLNGTITGIMLCKESDFDKSYKPHGNRSNLCIADGHYDLGSRPHNLEGQNITLNLGELKEGIYQIEWYGSVSKMAPLEMVSDGDCLEYEHQGRVDRLVFGLTDTDNVRLNLSSEAGYDNMWGDNYNLPDKEVDAYCWTGEITGIMLYRLSHTCSGYDDVINTSPITDLEYVPYPPRFVFIKPTSIESRGAQLCDLTRAKFANCILQSDGNVKSNKIDKKYCSVNITYLNEILPISKGKYLTFSVNKPIENTNYISIIIYGEFSDGFQFTEAQTHTNTVTMQIPDTLISVSKMELRVNGGSKAETDTESVFSNYMLNWGDKPAPYKPFTAEPIDTIEIHEEVQSSEGWGIGKSASEYNYIDLGRKVFVDEYEVVGDSVQKRENPIITDISELLPDIAQFLKVEGGGTVIFNNENKEAVPSKIKYLKRME